MPVFLAMLEAIRSRLFQRARRRDDAAAADGQPDATTVSLAVPSLFGGEPICRATVTLTTTRAGRGENWRLQAHVESCLRPPPVAPADRQLASASTSRRLTHRGQAAVSRLATRGVSLLPARMQPLFEQRVHTWLDLRGSSLPLVRGAEALMPGPLRDIHARMPAPRPGEPRVLAWQGVVQGRYPGIARFLSLQVDQDDFPPGSLGDRPFSLSASAATIVQSPAQASRSRGAADDNDR